MGTPNRADLHRRVDALASEEGLDIVERSPDVLGGTLVFRGTRVPARALFEYLAAGDSLEKFLDDFPSVRREQAVALLELVPSGLEEHATLQPGQTEIIAARPSA
ncbi:MAG: DUF433 domain-containing protein [Chloroflexi bacterium]|nr:DUF433 domain-containing protein [Chloroflexota bacterium]